ncbi:MAG: hypothetical protein IJB19_04030 [Clostridia bacterium]|nr:hypothetical protein [Clostridia bacterium]
MEEKESEQRRDPVARFWLSLLRGALILGLLFYLLYHLTNGFSAEMKTQTVKLTAEEQLLSTIGTVVRAELPVSASRSGVVSYHIADGEKVKANAKVAMVYSGYADSDTVARIAELDRSIELLEAAGIDGDTHVSDAADAEREIASRLLTLSEQIGRGDFSGAGEGADSLLSTFVRRDTILSGSGDSTRATLSALRAERESLAASLTGGSTAVRASRAGYFYSYADGGETVFNYDSVESLTPAEYRAGLSAMQSASAGTVGKIVLYPRWYLLCPVAEEEAKTLKAGSTYTLYFAGGSERLSMTLSAKNEGDGEVLLVFSTLEMPEDFDFDRTQKVSIVTETISGYKLPASALRIVDGNVGVYIRSGNTVKFRLVEVFYESGAYVFVRTDTAGQTLYANDADATNDIYCKGLSLYDNVIVSGAKELSPDRIVN